MGQYSIGMHLALLIATVLAPDTAAQTLAGTQPLTIEGDPAAAMLAGFEKYLERETAASVARRPLQPDRERFRRMIGLVDSRIAPGSLWTELTLRPRAATRGRAPYAVTSVRWAVFDGVDGVGLLVEPAGPIKASVVAVPDADQRPESFLAEWGARLAEHGCRVVIPVLLSREPVGIFNPNIQRRLNQTHREFVYRMAFELGRHVIGYEVAKVLAAADWLRQQPNAPPAVAIAGYGEGGLIALYSAAADERIHAALVSGYFGKREEVWREPVYRNVWGLLREFGDAEIARLVWPRKLIVEMRHGPQIAGPLPAGPENGTGAAPGLLTGPKPAEVREEIARARPALAEAVDAGRGVDALLRTLGIESRAGVAGESIELPKPPARRERDQFEQLVHYTQRLLVRSDFARKQFWSKADGSSVERWNQTTPPYRRHLWEEVIGKLPAPTEPLVARTRVQYDRPRFTGHEVQIPLFPDVFAYGVLLLPKDLLPGERRPLVVAQHGRAGRPQDLIEAPTPRLKMVYAEFAARLADRGFIVYAPQNPYIFEEQYRFIQRRANPLKLSLFSFIAAQHERTLEWLAGLPFVDPSRIGYYGLSYGGKTAVRVPPLLDRYALVITSGDFGEYAGKMASTDRPESFIYTIEHEMYEWNLANTFNYGDLAALIAPRPFMVERGHHDQVGFDEWVGYEYAKVRRLFTRLKIADRTEIEWFDGGHQINAQGTFRFLHRHLNWPER